MTGRYPRPGLLDRIRPGTTIIEASAGTGKTWTLERLVVDLLLTHGLTLDQILVVTYTEKAAGEMQERIRAMLQLLAAGSYPDAAEDQPHWRIGPEQARRLEAALAGFDRAGISTIHGFCQRVLQETAFLAGRPFESAMAPGDELFHRAFRTCLRERWATDESRHGLLRLAFEQLGTEEQLRDLLREADQAGRTGRLELAGGLPAIDLERINALPLAGAEAIQEVLAGWGVPKATAKPAARILEAFRRACGKAAQAGGLWPVLNEGLDEKPSEAQLAKFAEARDRPGPGGDLLRAYLSAREQGGGWVAQLAAAFLPSLQAELAALKEREALMDFDDMIRLVREALADPASGPALAQRLGKRYRATLVDEFQDADGAQWDIFRTAFRGPESFLVLIGDPKQAIYGFRGGDVETYLEARGTVPDPGRIITLDRNFRSTPQMIEAYNLIFTGPAGVDPLPDTPFFSGEIKYPDPVQPGKAGLDWRDAQGAELAPVALLPIELENGRKATGQVRRRVAEAVAREIQALLSQGTVFLDAGAPPEPLLPQDVFVLTRDIKDGLLAAEALRALRVPVAFYKQAGLARSMEAMDVLDLLSAVLDPADRSACARAWLTPFFGLAIADLEATRELADDHPLRARLLAWHALARARQYPELYRGLMDGSGLTRRLLLDPDPARQRSLGIYLQLLEQVLEQGSARRAPFESLVAEMRAFIEQGVQPAGEDPDLHRVETDQGAVQVLTMHKSKGLEAKVVAVIGKLGETAFHRPFRARRRHERRQRINWFGSADVPPLIEQLHQKEEREEEERLLYVALTRAKARLILPFFKAKDGAALDGRKPFDKAGNPVGQYGILNRRLQRFEAAGLLADGFTQAPTALREPAKPSPKAPLTLPPLPPFADLARAGRPRQVWSFTSISRALPDASMADPELRPGHAAPGELPGGTATGSCLHQVLEAVPLAGVLQAPGHLAWMIQEPVQGILLRALDDYGLDRLWAPEVARLAFKALTLPLALPGGFKLPALAGIQPALREMAFTFLRGPASDFFEGSIDLIFQEQGRTFFLDWKTNILPDYQPETCARVVAAHYDLQVKIYTLAALKFLGIRGRAGYEAFGGGIYLFLRGVPEGLGSHTFRPEWDQVEAWQAELAGIEKELADAR